VYVRHNELWRIAVDRRTGDSSAQLVAANDALMMYEPLLPAASDP